MKFYLGSDSLDDTMKAFVAAIPVIVIAVVPTLLGCNFFTPKINIVEKWAKQHGRVTQGHLKHYKTYGFDILPQLTQLDSSRCAVRLCFNGAAG